jgi:hypothetical protein
MLNFNQKPWNERKKQLGATAENAFERFAAREGIKIEPFGMHEESQLDYSLVPLWLRKRPDYVCQKDGKTYLTEVKGCGSDGLVKFPFESVEGLYFWQALIASLYVFIFDSSRKKCSFMLYRDLREKLLRIEPSRFERDGKLYFPLSIKTLSWSDI